MGVFNLAKLFGMTIRESANDGSDFTNPDADFRRLFLGEDGQLHVKDSAGTVTSIGGGLTDPMTDRGDVIVRNSSNVTARLGIGSSGKVLSSDGTDVSWQTPSAGGLTHAYVGYNTVGGSNENIVTRRQYMKKVTIASACVVTSISAYIKQVTTAESISMNAAILTDNAGSPEALIARAAAASTDDLFLSTSNGVAGAARWVHMALGTYLTAADYWFAVQFVLPAGGSHNIYYDGSGSDRYFTNGSDNRMSDSGWTTVTTSANKYSIRASIIS